MTRSKKLLLNTGSALVYQVITLVCGFVLPKFIIPYFGSAANGLISSITQFLTIITLCECGVGAVVQSALYKPLADKSDRGISEVVISSNRFFNKIVRILIVYVVVLMIVYPIIIRDEFSYVYTAAMVLILSLSYFAQYYLFLTYRLLLNADQLSFIQLGAHSLALILNTIFTVVLIKLGSSVHIVKLGSVAAFLIQPLIIKLYVDRHYHINLKLPLTKEPLKQKWNGLAQHIASVVQGNVATVVLTVFSTLENISIYSVYYLVAHGIRQVIVSLNTGIKAMLGNMLAKNETDTLNKTFSTVEFAFHTLVTLLFSITGILILPFVRIYTVNFTDALYIQPLFGALMVIGQAVYCLRIPYEMIIQAAGHYKQTQASSIIEAVINIIVAVALVLMLGLEGVAISTIAAMGYRTVYLAFYIRGNILNRPISHFVKHLLVDAVCVVLMIAATCWIDMYPTTYYQWLGFAAIVSLICCSVSFIINTIVYKREVKYAIMLILRSSRKEKK
ncbi:MAG: polysaccharide biosynthesis C-terminal domain-containing protein [Clostridia bacterium]|nr:polysaccharide biosynthesis C-terminal domain-containing protein [Clostridia bacterium]